MGRSVLGLDGFSYSSLQRRWREEGCNLDVPPGWFSAIFWAISTGVGMHPGGLYRKAWLSGLCPGFITEWLSGVGTML